MNEGLKQIADRLTDGGRLTREDIVELIRFRDAQMTEYLAGRAVLAREQNRDSRIEIVGQVELSNYCRNDCYYCRLRRENRFVRRYRMEEEEILSYCLSGYRQGIRTFLLQGGEDYYYSDRKMSHILERLRQNLAGCRLILEMGEKSRTTYREWRAAGADGYLLRLETSVDKYYRKLHPGNMSLLRRKQCLWELKELGYQIGTGFLIGTPWQTVEHLAEDITFLKQLEPEGVVLSPFLPAAGTPFEKQRAGSTQTTCFLLSVVRLLLPGAVLPISTEMAESDKRGRTEGLGCGADAVIVSLTTSDIQKAYDVYSRRSRSAGREETVEKVREELSAAGYRLQC